MTGAEEPALVRFISDEASGMGTDHLEGPDAGLPTHQVYGAQRDLGADFPGVPSLAPDHEVAGDAQREALNRSDTVEAVLPGTASKRVEKEEQARSQRDDQQADSNDSPNYFPKPLASSHVPWIASDFYRSRKRGQEYSNPVP